MQQRAEARTVVEDRISEKRSRVIADIDVALANAASTRGVLSTAIQSDFNAYMEKHRNERKAPEAILRDVFKIILPENAHAHSPEPGADTPVGEPSQAPARNDDASNRDEPETDEVPNAPASTRVPKRASSTSDPSSSPSSSSFASSSPNPAARARGLNNRATARNGVSRLGNAASPRGASSDKRLRTRVDPPPRPDGPRPARTRNGDGRLSPARNGPEQNGSDQNGPDRNAALSERLDVTRALLAGGMALRAGGARPLDLALVEFCRVIPGMAFGGLEVFCGDQRTATAVAGGPSDVVVLPRAVLLQRLTPKEKVELEAQVRHARG